MSGTFDADMDAIRREILALKAQKEKAANTIQVKEYTLNLSFTLGVHYYVYEYIRSTLMAVIDIDPGENNPLLSFNFDIESTDNRVLRATPRYDSNTGHLGYLVYIYSNNQSDFDKIHAGETVTLNYTVKIQSTAELTINTSYQDLWVD